MYKLTTYLLFIIITTTTLWISNPIVASTNPSVASSRLPESESQEVQNGMLRKAILDRSIEDCKRALNKGADVNTKDYMQASAIHLAIRSAVIFPDQTSHIKSLKIVIFLLTYNPELNTIDTLGETPGKSAQDCKILVRILQAHGISFEPEEERLPPLTLLIEP